MGTTAEKLALLKESKKAIKESLETPSDVMSEYSKWIKKYIQNQPTNTVSDGVCTNALDVPLVSLGVDGNSKQARLPKEYQEVEYIKSTGTQYIDTNYKANNRTKISISFFPNDNNYGMLFGGRINSEDVNQFGLFYNTSDYLYSFRFADNPVIKISKTVNLKTFAEFSTTKYLIDNGSITEQNIEYSGTFTGTLPMYLFAMNGNDNNKLCVSTKLYNCKIYDNDILVRDFVPCYRKSDNEIGLYDLINGVFYTNSGTETFLKGNDTPNPDYPQDIEVIKGFEEGNQFGLPYGHIGLRHSNEDDSKEEIIPINLNDNTLAKVGDVKDLLKIYRNGDVEIDKLSNRYLFSGNDDENWDTWTSNLSNKYRIHTPIISNLVKKPIDNKSEIKILSNYFQSSSTENTVNGIECIAITTTGQVVIYSESFNDSNCIEQFKNWLNEKELYLLYPLATPETIKLPSIEPIELWEGTNKFELITNLDTTFEIEYVVNKNNILDEVQTAMLEAEIEI